MEEEEAFQKIFELCESDPDAGLEFIRKAISEKPVLESYAFLKVCKARAYQIKGIQPLIDRQSTQIRDIETKKLCSYLSDENLYYVELALSEIIQIGDVDPEAMKLSVESFGEEQIDAIASVLERCRPGRVQEISGKTKLQYFGIDRISTVPHLTDAEKLPPEELRPFLQISFSFPSSIVKSALVFQTGKDVKGHKYILCWLFEKVFDDFGDDETYGDAKVGEIYLFDDGTFADALEEEHKIGMSMEEFSSEELAILLQHGQTLTDDVTDEAMEVRDRSRLLTCAFLGRVIILTGIAKGGDTSESDYFRQIRSSFVLGYIAEKEHDVVKLLDTSTPEIGDLNDELNNEEIEFCIKLCNTIERDELKNEPDEFLSKHRIAENILKAISQVLMKMDDITEDVASGKLCGCFVLGYIASKYPERFEELHKDKMEAETGKEPIRKEEPTKKGFFKKLFD